ncbi:MAG TPA: hypothetical protein VGG23_05495 [Acidimicrobiales bacterium]
MTTSSTGRRRAAAVAMVIALAGSVPLVLSQPGTAGAAVEIGPLHPVSCGPLPGDPPLETPGYAEQDGAGAGSGNWWCELPHATAMPSNFVAFRRSVSPISGGTYADYGTEYVLRGRGTQTAAEAGGPTITVSSEVNSTVSPPAHLHYPQPGKGRVVSLGHGVEAMVTSTDGIVTASWRYPSSGVPKYLRAVVQVSVVGTHVPRSTVLAVARQVRPD